MPAKFENTPLLVELIAELRWNTPTLQLPVGGSVICEQLFAHFGAIAALHGFNQFGRMVPVGLSERPFEPVVSYRPADPLDVSPIYQLGNGMFSAHALPPHKNWIAFEPKVRIGLEMLRDAFQNGGRDFPSITVAIVRYIDAFRPSPAPYEPTLTLITEAVGHSVRHSPTFQNSFTEPQRVAPDIPLVIPLASGDMTVRIAEGAVESETAVIMDMAVTIAREFGADPASAMNALVEARAPIHELFVDVMQTLHGKMGASNG